MFSLRTIQTWQIDRGEWSVSHTDRFNPLEKKTAVDFDKGAGWAPEATWTFRTIERPPTA